MKCANHPEAEATGYCRECGKPLCALCVRPVRDALYCEECLANLLGPNAPAATPAKPAEHAPSPMLAFFLGFFPGLGAFYNEQYGKGIMFLALFLFLFVAGAHGEPGGMAAALRLCVVVLWLYMPIDAYRVAKAKRAGHAPPDPFASIGRARLLGPVLLIVFGAVLLLSNFHLFPLGAIFRLWPLILVIIGIAMFKDRLAGGS